MKVYESEKIKNVAFLGHSAAGKTTLADAIIYCCGEADRIGKTADGTAVLDFDPQEKKRGCSISTAVYAVETGDQKINLIDAPGLFDFAGGISEALTAADSAIITISGKSGITVGAKQAYDKARAAKKSVAFFIGKLDSSHAHFYRVVSALVELYGAVICPIIVPYVVDDAVKCYVNLIENQAYTFSGNKPAKCDMPSSSDIDSMRDMLVEAIASADESLMEKYFEGEAFTREEMEKGLRAGVLSGDICPVYCGVQQTGEGISFLIDSILNVFPSAKDKNTAEAENSALVFKTIADPFVGKLSYFKVLGGEIKGDMRLKNNRTGDEERIAKVMWLKAGKQEDAPKVPFGDIGCVSKLSGTLTGDTLSASGKVEAKEVEFPRPTLKAAVYPVKKGDEEKISTGLSRICEEDPSFEVYSDPETHEQIIVTLGEQHTDVVLSKLSSKFGCEAKLEEPKIAYRETIKKSVKAQGRHKKQSGGHGQFGDVWIEFEPCDSDELVFEEKVFGGAVPKNFFPAVEKGLRDSAQTGVLAGFKMVGIKATLYDGSYHPVDSSEMAFKTAASLAFKEGISNANPVLLEPIYTLKVLVPDEMLGDVIGDINKRRGRIMGMEPTENKLQEVTAEVPIAEMSDFSTAMRAISQGMATFTTEFARYEEVPAAIMQKVIEKAKEDNQ
ncbi:MAG: elongation factor G [Clostridia bacterium]|nr:elongation factor G [Clostridia bacterium]